MSAVKDTLARPTNAGCPNSSGFDSRGSQGRAAKLTLGTGRHETHPATYQRQLPPPFGNHVQLPPRLGTFPVGEAKRRQALRLCEHQGAPLP